MRAGWRLAALLFVGALLMQAAWILALPPFRGSDEVDHAYRAAEVAHGEAMPAPVPAPHGRGDLVAVPRSLVRAARPICLSYSYMGRDNCYPVQDLGDGMVTAASSASQYNPAFYWVIGTPARLATGADSLYIMRTVAAVLCAAFLALAGWATSLWAKTRWPIAALLLAMTPVAIYSTAVAAPNGIEMCAALAVWMALLGLSRAELLPRVERTLLWCAVPAAVVLTTVRSLGPLWLLLAGATAVAAAGWRRAVDLVRRHPRDFAAAGVVVGAATVASLWWVHVAATLTPNPTSTDGAPDSLGHTLPQLPLWVLQSIAAFPFRDQYAPTVVYALGLLVAGVLLVAGWRAGSRHLRGVFLATAVLSLAIPFVMTLATYSQRGPIWQGRYGLPYSFGAVLLLGLILDRAGYRHRLAAAWLGIGWAALTVANLVGVGHVIADERATSPLSGTAEWLTPPVALIVAVMFAGWVVWAVALRHAPTGSAAPVAEPDEAVISVAQDEVSLVERR